VIARALALSACLAAGCNSGALAPDLVDFAVAARDLAQPPDLRGSSGDDLGTWFCPTLSLDGTESATAPTLAALVPAGSLTVEAWVFVTSPRGGLVAGVIDPDSGVGPWSLSILNGGGLGLVINGTGGGTFLATSGLGIMGKWHHVAGVFDAALPAVALYLDGHQVAHGSTEFGGLRMTPSPLFVGHPPPAVMTASGYQGYLADLRVSAGARYTQDFVPERLLASDANTVALYHFDEALGTLAHDASASHNDAKLMDGAAFASPPVCR
jgi:hypothetical protein